jgi:DNA-binding PadR family transcriptional regulator
VAVQQEVVLALLAKEPSHGYQLRARLRRRSARSATR